MISSYTMSMRVLLVEDEHKIAAYVKRGLQESGYAVDAVFTGRDALDWVGAAPYDLIILDIMLPVIDGLTVCRELRHRGDRTPVLMLTARDDVDDRVAGLDAGADDYLVKPFAMKELLARMRALTRRTDQPKSSVLSYADLSLDTRTHQVRRGGQLISLALKEFSVLDCLLREPGRVLAAVRITRADIFDFRHHRCRSGSRGWTGHHHRLLPKQGDGEHGRRGSAEVVGN